MPFVLTPYKRELDFLFDARTSRGAMKSHQANYLRLHHTENPELAGWGECSPLPGLSPDYSTNFFAHLQKICHQYNSLQLDRQQEEEGERFWEGLEPWPSIRFAWESAWVDFLRGGKRNLYPSPFTRGEDGIRINGLIWMGNPSFMREQIEKKMQQGYTCLKMKIGGPDFAQELEILKEIRSLAGPEILELRLDANGAFKIAEAEEKLKQLSLYDVHSIEQPIQPGQLEDMARLCRVSPIPIALDEELISIIGKENKWQFLKKINPSYIIIKPTLVGGLASSREWVQVARSLNIGWWLTSALESNIGLNAIAQFVAEIGNPMPQGLGTGQLYHNNIPSPLEIRGEKLWYNPSTSWQLPETP